MKTVMYALVCSISFMMITGCEPHEKIANPVISKPFVIDGCTVKYIDRGLRSDSFYIAKCGKTTTITGNEGDKASTENVTIIDEPQLNADITTMLAKQTALNKLSQQDKEVLGLVAPK